MRVLDEVDGPTPDAVVEAHVALPDERPRTARGLVDELFVTLSPRVISGASSRIVHGPDADPAPWHLRHGFVDDDGFPFLRYISPTRAAPA